MTVHIDPLWKIRPPSPRRWLHKARDFIAAVAALILIVWMLSW